ncbi:substrate-binding periplasmic protein [Andreprevotia lacus]|uniref:substrate-binding periplasmic protein n=1 Tax=Andreprevotia lacus TaxID=1121000 RepID=UPI00159349F4|nr:transporter substrate-binding domain-containing protein [Andreprevotia lacus]
MVKLAKCSLMLMALGCFEVAGAGTLRFSVTESWSMPLGRFVQGRLVEGIMFDLMQAIAQNAGSKPEFVVLPRKRIDAAFQQNLADVRCYVSRNWVAKPDSYLWSGPLFSNEDLIVSFQQRKPVPTLSSFNGAHVGTVLGYVYPPLDEAFASGALVRDDAADELTAARKAKYGRTDLVIMHRLMMDWLRKVEPLPAITIIYPVQRFDVECGVSKRSQLDPLQVQGAIESLRRSGEIERILQRYR